METTTKPLYKVLDQKRIGGEWRIDNECLKCGDEKINYIHADTDFLRVDDLANAEYTVLAVNNLYNLAEALEGLIKAADHSNCDSISVDKAKEALSKIS